MRVWVPNETLVKRPYVLRKKQLVFSAVKETKHVGTLKRRRKIESESLRWRVRKKKQATNENKESKGSTYYVCLYDRVHMKLASKVGIE